MAWDGESIVAGIGIIASLGWQQWALHRSSQKERAMESKKVAEAIEKRDERLEFILQEHPLHSHVEDDTESCLRPAGIRYPRTKMGD